MPTKKKIVAHYKQTTVAFAPDVLVQCINKHSDKYEAILIGEGPTLPEIKFREGLHPDIIHCHNRRYTSSLPSLIQYHSPCHESLVDINFDGKQVVIAQYHALIEQYKDMTRVRNIIDIYSDEYKPNYDYDKIRIGYSPTVLHDASGSPEDKGYDKTVAILERLRDKFDIEIDVITKVSLAECIERKSQCCILIDECVTDSYHRCTLEGLALGKVVICSASLDVLQVFQQASGYNKSPFFNLPIDGLEEWLGRYLDKPIDMMHKRGKENREWMEKFWDPRDIVREYELIYDEILR